MAKHTQLFIGCELSTFLALFAEMQIIVLLVNEFPCIFFLRQQVLESMPRLGLTIISTIFDSDGKFEIYA